MLYRVAQEPFLVPFAVAFLIIAEAGNGLKNTVL